MDHRQIRSCLREHARHEGEVVILHQHHRRISRGTAHRFGEQPVQVAVGVPGLGEPAIHLRPTRGIEEVMVREPQRGVRHHVVSHLISLRIGLDHHKAEATFGHEPVFGGHPVGVGHRARHPGGPTPLEYGMKGSRKSPGGAR